MTFYLRCIFFPERCLFLGWPFVFGLSCIACCRVWPVGSGVILTSISITRGKLNVASWNAHSLKNKIPQVNQLIRENRLDVFIICESWLGPAIASSTLSIRGYELLRRDRDTPADQQGLVPHGGVCVYVRKSVVVLRKCELEEPGHETMWLEFKSGNSTLIVCAAYKAPNRQIAEFVEHLGSRIAIMGARETIIIGDLNVHHTSPGAHMLQSFFDDHGFQQLILDPTHYYCGPDGQSRTSIIDVIWTNRLNRVADSGPIDYEPGQVDYHVPVFISYAISLPPLVKIMHTKRNFCEGNIQMFLELMGRQQWNFENAESGVRDVDNTLSNLTRECFPMIEYSTTDKSIPDISPEIRREINIKYRLRAENQRRRTDATRIAYNRQCNHVRWLCRNHRRQHLRDEILNCDNSRTLWKTLKTLLPIGRKKSTVKISLRRNDNSIIDSEFDVASTFNDYFASVGVDLASQIPLEAVDPLSYVERPDAHSSFFLHPVTRQDVIKEANQIGADKALSDVLPYKILKRAIVFLALPISIIINMSFREAFVPAALKHAVVTCIYKDGDRDSVKNYRPISVLPLIAKILESIVYKQLSNFLNTREVLYSYQSGYRAEHSCESALNELIAIIHSEVDAGSEVAVVFLDLRRAFDTIDRQILFKKLERMGVRGHALQWFVSLLGSRTQSVKIGNTLSTCKDMPVGVPQGSALGPLLFSLYINDIYRSCRLPNMMLFADDTALVYKGDLSTQLINSSLSRICTWLNANKLTLNATKTKFMLFSRRLGDQRSNLDLLMNNEPIEKVPLIKYLGVHIDEKLTFTEHVNNVITKVKFIHSVLYLNKSFISPHVGEQLILALAIPRFMYCSTVFHRTSADNLLKLDVMFRKMIRTVFRLDYDISTSIIYSDTRFLPLCLQRQIQAASLAFRALSGCCPAYMTDYIHPVDHERRRRPPRAVAVPTENFIVPFMRSHQSHQSIRYWGPVILNAVPPEIIDQALTSALPVKCFTINYRKYLTAEFHLTNWNRRLETARSYFSEYVRLNIEN
jgi:hypothetical protein